jgi:short-subunit dehydrogenase
MYVEEKKVAIVTGCSSGIGLETSKILARNGFYTYATMRNTDKIQETDKSIRENSGDDDLPLRIIRLDVNDDTSVHNAIDTILSERQKIDILVNNAGYALVGPLRETSIDEMKAQFETNFFGAIRVIKVVLPTMRTQRSGRIVNIVSMGGRIAVPLDSIYHGTKFGLEGVSESLQYELEQFGIKIVLIEPGAVRSNFWANLKIAKSAEQMNNSNSPYSQLIQTVSKAFERMSTETTAAGEVAKVVLEAVTSDDPSFRYVVGKDAQRIMDTRKNMSDKHFKEWMMENFGLA